MKYNIGDLVKLNEPDFGDPDDLYGIVATKQSDNISFAERDCDYIIEKLNGKALAIKVTEKEIHKA